MIFITAGMGGGTGTGAAPVIARVAREQGMLTVGVVTKPFHFEGHHRMEVAENGIKELQKYVDTLIVIPNQNLFRIANEQTTFATAFKMADDVLMAGVKGVTDLMVMPGLINLDFADIRAIMTEMGKAMMGTGEATGEGRSIKAAEAAISNPLLDDISMKGAQGVLINITGGPDMTLFEVDEAANRIRQEIDPTANIIFGSTFDAELEGIMRVSVVATGIEQSAQKKTKNAKKTTIDKKTPTKQQDDLDLFGTINAHPDEASTNITKTSESTAPIFNQSVESSPQEPQHFMPQEAVVPQHQAPTMNAPFSEDFNTAPAQEAQRNQPEKPSFLKRIFSGKKQQSQSGMQEQQTEYTNHYSDQSVQFNTTNQSTQQPVQERQPFAPSHFQPNPFEQPQQQAQTPQINPQTPPHAENAPAAQQPTTQTSASQEQIANDNLAIPAFLRRQQKT